MVEDERVFAIVGHFGTPVVAATVDMLKDYGIPAVYFATGIRQLYSTAAFTNEQGRNIFPVQPLFVTEGKILTAFAAGKFGANKIGVIYTNDDAGLDLYEGVREQVALLPGVELVSQQVTAGSPDVSAAVTAIRNANVDFVIAATNQGTFPTIVIELAAQGVNRPVITSYVNTAEAMSVAVVDQIQGRFDVFSTGWLDLLAAPEDIETYVQWIDPDFAGNAFGQAGWIAAATFVAGLRRIEGQDITWDNFIKAMEEGPISIPFGGSVSFENGVREGVQEMTLSKIVPISEEWPMGWEMVAPMTNMNDLLRDLAR
jgi:ABC-type branched-subunit amino acid transport system substrate-binding protein